MFGQLDCSRSVLACVPASLSCRACVMLPLVEAERHSSSSSSSSSEEQQEQQAQDTQSGGGLRMLAGAAQAAGEAGPSDAARAAAAGASAPRGGTRTRDKGVVAVMLPLGGVLAAGSSVSVRCHTVSNLCLSCCCAHVCAARAKAKAKQHQASRKVPRARPPIAGPSAPKRRCGNGVKALREIRVSAHAPAAGSMGTHISGTTASSLSTNVARARPAEVPEEHRTAHAQAAVLPPGEGDHAAVRG